jgi:hypothetical protein
MYIVLGFAVYRGSDNSATCPSKSSEQNDRNAQGGWRLNGLKFERYEPGITNRERKQRLWVNPRLSFLGHFGP